LTELVRRAEAGEGRQGMLRPLLYAGDNFSKNRSGKRSLDAVFAIELRPQWEEGNGEI